MTEEKIITNQSVLVRGNRIYRIGKSDKIKIPQKAKVIDGKGAYLMPGLADMHVHLTGEWPLSQMDIYLANGVTTVRDLDGRDFMLHWRQEIKKGKRIGPTIYAAGPIIRGDENNAPELVSKQKSGYDCLKLYAYFSKDDYKKSMNLAKAQNLYTVGHIPFAVGLDGIIAEGMNEIAHIEELIWELIDFDRNKNLPAKEWFPYLKQVFLQHNKPSLHLEFQGIKKEYLERIKTAVKKLEGKNIIVNTTLYLDEIIIQKLFEPEKFLAQTTSAYLPQKYINSFLQGKEKHQIQFKAGEDLAPVKYAIDKMLLIELNQADIPLVLGTDAGTGKMGVVPGFSIHNELRILTENGFSPYEAIVTATVNASKVVEQMIGRNDFGTLEIGKRADLILVLKNPLDDVSNIKDSLGVMAAGRWYGLNEIQKMIDSALLPTIPVIGGVVNVRTAKDEFITVMDVIIGKSFTGKLPDDIETISVKGPQGVLPLSKEDFTFWPTADDFYVVIPGSPKVGTYTFTVTSGKREGSASDTQSSLLPIPVPGLSTFSPADGEILKSKTPTFSWGGVIYFNNPVYYLFQIYDSEGEQVYRRGRSQGMTSHTVPAGILKPGENYRWRIRVSDSGHWMEEQNRSHTKRLSFKMAETLE
jgi:imidazolonepropionase-like amidohydrolase